MSESTSASGMDRLRSIPVPVSVQVCGRTLTLAQFLGWKPGTILSFEKQTSTSLELRIGDRTIGEGLAVKVGTKIGLRIDRMERDSLLKNLKQ